MNKRQKAKHYKQLYERELALNRIRPVKVQHSVVPFVTYKAVNNFDTYYDGYPKDENGIPNTVREQITKEISDIIYENIKIIEVQTEEYPVYKRYEANIKMAFE